MAGSGAALHWEDLSTSRAGNVKKMNQLCINKKRRDQILLGVDGGVNLTTIDKVYDMGVDVTVVGSGLYKAPDIITRFKELENK